MRILLAARHVLHNVSELGGDRGGKPAAENICGVNISCLHKRFQTESLCLKDLFLSGRNKQQGAAWSRRDNASHDRGRKHHRLPTKRSFSARTAPFCPPDVALSPREPELLRRRGVYFLQTAGAPSAVQSLCRSCELVPSRRRLWNVSAHRQTPSVFRTCHLSSKNLRLKETNWSSK